MTVRIGLKRWYVFGALLSILSLGAGPITAPSTPSARAAHVINHVYTNKKIVALTFDDGPTRKWTPQILQALKAQHVKATFFIIGTHANRIPNLLQQEIKDGMEIGNHGAKHLLLKNQNIATIRGEILDNASLLKSYGAPTTNLYRLPAGVSSRKALEVLHALHYKVIGWSIDTRDWRRKYTAEQMTSNVIKHVEPGSIVIFHDGPNSSQQTVNAVKQIITQLKAKGYAFDTVSQLLKAERH